MLAAPARFNSLFNADRAGTRRLSAKVLAYPVMAALFLIAAFAYHAQFRHGAYLEDLFKQQADYGYSQWGSEKVVYTLDYDSILYESLFRDGVDLGYLVSNYTTMPNVMGISVLAALTKSLGIEIFQLNVLMLLATGWLITRVASLLKLSPVLPLACVYLNPVTIFNAQTATKEIPLIAGCSLLIYLVLKFRRGSLILVAAPVLAFLAFTRVQTGGLLGCGLLLSMLPYRKAVTLIWVSSAGLFALFPLTSLTGFWLGADYYREMSGRVGIGEYIDLGLKYIPFAGYLCIPLRAIHNALDPFPFAPFMSDGKSIWSVYACMNHLSFYYSSFVFIGLIPLLWRYLTFKCAPSRAQHAILLFVLVGWTSVAIVPYVQGRYLYPFMPVAAFALSFSIKLVSSSARKSMYLAWFGIACLQTWIGLAALPW